MSSVRVRSRAGRLALTSAIACVLAAPLWAAEGDGAAPASGENAVWTPKELDFVYMGFTSRYSCDGLQDKIRGILLDLGARKKDLKVVSRGCTSPGGGPDPFPGVKIHMSVLQPASGATGATDDTQTPVQAHWKPVDLKLRETSLNDSGECELVEQVRRSIVPLFATRNVELNTVCVPHQASATRPSLKLEVLAPDKTDSAAAKGGAAG